MSKLVVKETGANFDDDAKAILNVLKVVDIDFDKTTETIQFTFDIGEDSHYIYTIFDLDDFEHAVAKAKANPIED